MALAVVLAAAPFPLEHVLPVAHTVSFSVASIDMALFFWLFLVRDDRVDIFLAILSLSDDSLLKNCLEFDHVVLVLLNAFLHLFFMKPLLF